MSRTSIAAALLHGQSLPSFPDLESAEESLLSHRDQGLKALEGVETLCLDYSPDSLAELERWYFACGKPLTLAGCLTAHAIGFYFGEVLCRLAGYQWLVQPFVFEPGTYEIGVNRKNLSIMLTTGMLPNSQRNKRMESLLRAFRKYAA